MSQTQIRPNAITVAELREWIGPKLSPKCSDECLRRAANRMNNFRWPGDSPANFGEPGYVPIRTYDKNEKMKWQFDRRVGKSARFLHDRMDEIVASVSDEYSDPALRTLMERLQLALDGPTIEFLEYPLGRYKPRRGPRTHKEWHSYATGIAQVLIGAMQDAGIKNPSIARDCVVPRVVLEVLHRFNVRDANVTPTAVSAYLTRWKKKHGLEGERLSPTPTNLATPVL